MHPGAELALREAGADPTGFRSRPLSAGLLAAAGLVLTATREQRAIGARLLPAAVGRTFTLRQAGRLLSTVDESGDIGALVAAIGAARGRAQPVAAVEDDLADPVNGTPADVRACVARIQASLRPVFAFIGAS
jgi:protein-tyrosine phosphatase